MRQMYPQSHSQRRVLRIRSRVGVVSLIAVLSHPACRLVGYRLDFDHVSR